MTQMTQDLVFLFTCARAGGKIPDPASHASLRHGPKKFLGWACTCPTRETRPAEYDHELFEQSGEVRWHDEFEELGEALRWDEALQRWIRPSCPLHGDGHATRKAERYTHVWWWGRPHRGADPYDPPRKGRRCRVLCQGNGGGPRNVAVLLEGDDEPVIVPRWAVRRAR